MTKNTAFFTGLFAMFALSALGLVYIPQCQIGALAAQSDEETGEVYPIDTGGYVARGRAVYIANGCVYCHTQQVRDGFNGSDLARGWGQRRTVSRDYIYEVPPLGSSRIGPDLANIGARKPDPAKAEDSGKYSEAWHYEHLYNPRATEKESVMPAFRYLFATRKISGQRSVDALALTGSDAPAPGYEVVPTADAKALVSYLKSLDHSHELKEAPAMKEAAKK